LRRISNPRSISGQVIVHRAKIRHGNLVPVKGNWRCYGKMGLKARWAWLNT
jgi:hypothetical protein